MRKLLWSLTIPALSMTPLLMAEGAVGSSAPPVLTWSPTTSTGTYDFGTLDATAGQRASTTFALTNSGGRASGDLTPPTLSGSSAFTITTNDCKGSLPANGKSCSVNVEYAPTSDGETDTATLLATSTQTSGSIILSGKSGTPLLTIDPPATCAVNQESYPSGCGFNFGTVPPGATATRLFTLTNVGTATTKTLAFLGDQYDSFIRIPPPDTCAYIKLAPSGSCTFTVSFTTPAYLNACLPDGEPPFPQFVRVVGGLGELGYPIYLGLLVGGSCWNVNLKGSLPDTGALPTSGNELGDAYLISGHEWIWTGRWVQWS